MEQRRFDRGAKLAWAVERGGGYRSSAHIEWQFVDLDDVRCTSSELLDVGELVGELGTLPKLLIKPAASGRIEAVAENPMVVWALTEDEPTLETDCEEVAYGTVIRVGPLLVAPLDDEQHASIEKGRMSLREPPALVGEAPHRDSGSDFLLYATARRRLARRFALSVFGAMLITITPSGFMLFDEYIRRHDWGLPIFIALFFLVIFFIAWAPFIFAMVRWQRTPGAWSSSEDVGRNWPSWITVPLGALALYFIPWIIGTSFATLLTMMVCQPRNRDLTQMIMASSMIMTFVVCILFAILGSLYSDRLAPRILRWYGPPSRFLTEPSSNRE